MFEDYIGGVSFEKIRKIQLENISEDYGEEPEYEIVDEIEDVEDCEDEEESVSRRIVIVEELKEKEQEAEERQEQWMKERQELEAEEQQEQEAKEQVEQEAKERDQTVKEQQGTYVYRAEKLLKRGGMPLFPPGRRQWGERQVLISSNPTKIYWPPRNWQKYTPTEVNKQEVRSNGAGA